MTFCLHCEGFGVSNYIPFELRVLVNQIDPRLDMGWDIQLKNIFQSTARDICENIHKQILSSKGIYWDQQKKEFSLINKEDFAHLIKVIHHLGMKQLAEKVNSSLTYLEEYQDVEKISDYLEGILSQIEDIDVGENLDLQKFKQKVKQVFIYTAADIIRAKTTLVVPKNVRDLSVKVLKNFILEVYLKKELLGFAFKTIRPYALLNEQEPILSDFLVAEQKVRQLEVIKTSEYIFALAPTTQYSVNLFSVRRFLHEETLVTSSDNVYLNGAFLKRGESDPEKNNHFKWQVSKIVTIEKNVSHQLLELVDSLEKYNTKELRALLFEKLDASGLSTEQIVQQRLWDFEQKLSIYILEKIDAAVIHVMHKDESDYLFVSIRQIMSDILSYFNDFRLLPITMFSNKAHVFLGRLTAYLQLLEKKQQDIFIVSNKEFRQSSRLAMSQPLNELKALCKEGVDEMRNIKLELKNIEKDLGKKSLISRFFSSNKKKNEQINDLKLREYKIKERTYLEIVRIPKKYQNYTVYLEFEALISINSTERHYAFSTGNNWVKRLPLLVQLPEDRSLFNVRGVLTTLEFDLSKVNQKWEDVNAQSLSA